MRSRRKEKESLHFFYFSKYLFLFFVFLALTLFTNNNKVIQKLVPSKNYYQKTTSEAQNTNDFSQSPFNWTVEKVDEHITKIAIPSDPRMSTADELFEAMNNYRSVHQIQTFQKSDLLCSIAQNRANELIAKGELDNHEGFSKYAKNQQEFSRMGEVLFGGVQPVYGVHIVEYGWDRSLTGHKEAIQNPDWQYGCGGIAGYFAVFIFGSK